MPGAEEMALFDRIGGLIRGEDTRFDLIVFDTAPTGHTLRLIRMPELMEAWIRALSRSRQAMLGIEQDDKTDPVMISLTDRLEGLREFRARLLSPRVTAFLLVLVAERLPIEETARAIEQLNEAGVNVGGLVVNRILPATSPDPFLQSRHAQEVVYLDEIDRRFAKHSRVRVPQLPSDVHGVKTLEALSEMLVPLATENLNGCLHRGSDHDDRPTRCNRVCALLCRLRRQGRRSRPAAFLAAQLAEFERIRGLADTKGDLRYAEGKWSVKEVLGHMADAERVFAYRLLRIARADKTPLAGFDENAWAEIAPHGRRPLADVVDDLIAVRRATITLVDSLDEAALGNVGVANNNPVSRPRDLLDHPGSRPAPPRDPRRALRSLARTGHEPRDALGDRLDLAARVRDGKVRAPAPTVRTDRGSAGCRDRPTGPAC